ncbi:hypothetical protein [Sulfuracidifex metallicus]|uniref:Uncharacterized protein n=1 Tax=Sulfuracidifex metallicus DSM 6482 = JCM 9184 TaxID=523847 RepID=A0A6A9QLM2_SULME|nr:hypothetical protein [Sulfuracidifex metallicus]MUN29444.1 hypothetical protein [Sulfuracidifex metallicus DSM 6482 = JCM 9184]WOE50045.1 hypothetical protein RQ359_001545 [Sulfuracidifex metallicus DSM 6482 = JCM 9184]
MKAEDLYIKLRETKDTLNVESIRAELARMKESLERLKQSYFKLNEIVEGIVMARKMLTELQEVDRNDRLSERLNRIVIEIKSLYNKKDPDQIVNDISYVHHELMELIKDIEYTSDNVRVNLKNKIEEINKLLKVYARILLQFLEEENVEVMTFTVNSSSIHELSLRKREAEEHLGNIKSITIDKIKKKGLDERALTLMIKLIEDSKIRVNKTNLEDVNRVSKLLVEKGIQLEISL